jgi:peptide/nickel transport system permease protein
MVNLAPGDPVAALINPETAALLGPEWYALQRERLGLDAPVPVRYVRWISEIAQGNFGYSTFDRLPVINKIADRVWPTLYLMLTVQVISLTIAIPVGIISALKQYSTIDYAVTIFGFAAISIPSFFLALGAIYIFSLKLGWLPVANMRTLGQEPSIGDYLSHLVLPATVLGLANAAPLIRYVRSSMLEVIRQDYVRVARAKGLGEWSVIMSHAARNALIPLITVIALTLPAILGGTVVIETIFAWPGMGQLAISAVRNRDYPMIMALNMIIATLILLSNLLADILYAAVDPRIKYD